MKKKETEAQARERRKKQYGCDGLCYGGMNDDGVMCQPCGGIDTCEETRYIEAFATWGAALVILLTPIAMVAGFASHSCNSERMDIKTWQKVNQSVSHSG